MMLSLAKIVLNIIISMFQLFQNYLFISPFGWNSVFTSTWPEPYADWVLTCHGNSDNGVLVGSVKKMIEYNPTFEFIVPN